MRRTRRCSRDCSQTAIDDPAEYVFRGVVADSVRGLEVLLTRPEVDLTRVAVVGNDVSLMTAALGRGATHLVTAPALFSDTMALARQTREYPLEEINDYLRAFPERADAVRRTFGYYDLRAFAPRVRAATLLLAGAPGAVPDASALELVATSLGGPVTVHVSERSTYKDGLYVERWIARQHGIEDVESILPEHWR